MIFDTYNFDFNNLYNIADCKTKNMIDTYIEEAKDKGLLTGYFGILTNNIYKRTRVKNNEILELLIYGAYIEEQSKLDEYEKQIIYDDMNYYYQSGQKEVNNTLDKKKPISIMDMALFLYLMQQPNYNGLNMSEYIESVIQYNANQLYRQALINIQQQKELKIENDEFKSIVEQQNNKRLSINEDKISGFIDLSLIGLNNKAKIEGIYSFDDKAKVRFVGIADDKQTDMCKSLNYQEFYVHDWNEFKRYSKTNDCIKKYRCYGLVIGLNCPPINDGFHWCRSYIIYIANNKKTEYNLDIPKINEEVKTILKDTKLNNRVKKLFDKYLTAENVKIDNSLNGAMGYNVNSDKIIINPSHQYFKYYDLQESLTHEIIHMIDIRNNISEKLNIDNELRKARLNIDANDQEYINLLNSSKYENNMTLGDIFSAVTNGKISNVFGHATQYWLEDIKRIEKELSANIMSAYLTNNKDTIDILNSIDGLKRIKEKVVKEYGAYTN